MQALQEAAGACQEAQHAQQASRAFASRVHCMAAADFDDVAEVDESGEDSDDAEEAYGFSLGSLGPGAMHYIRQHRALQPTADREPSMFICRALSTLQQEMSWVSGLCDLHH